MVLAAKTVSAVEDSKQTKDIIQKGQASNKESDLFCFADICECKQTTDVCTYVSTKNFLASLDIDAFLNLLDALTGKIVHSVVVRFCKR